MRLGRGLEGEDKEKHMHPVDVRVTGSLNDGFDLLLGSSASSDADAYLAGAATTKSTESSLKARISTTYITTVLLLRVPLVARHGG